MYYPYLRGKQAELGALKELALDKKLSRKVIPVIEPIKQTIRLLEKSILKEVLNPKLMYYILFILWNRIRNSI